MSEIDLTKQRSGAPPALRQLSLLTVFKPKQGKLSTTQNGVANSDQPEAAVSLPDADTPQPVTPTSDGASAVGARKKLKARR